MLFVIRLQATQDLYGVLDRGLVHIDLLEPAHQRAVLLEVVAVFLVGGRTDTAQLAAGQRRLEQVRGVHGPAGGGPGTDHRVNLINEENRTGHLFNFVDHHLQAFFEITAIAGAREQSAHIEGKDRGIGQDLGNLTFNDTLGETLCDGGFADTRVAHIKRVVLGAAGQNLDRPLDFVLTPDQRIDIAVLGLLIEMDAIGAQRLLPFLDDGFAVFGLFLGAAHGPRIFLPGHLGDAVGDVVDGVETGHFLLLEEIDRMTFALGENCHQHVRASHFFTARGLHVNGGTLQHTLEPGCRLRFLDPARDQAGKLFVDVFGQIAPQMIDIDPTGAQDSNGVLILREREQQMLQGRVFMVPLVGQRQRAVQRLFEVLRQHLRRLPFASGLHHPVVRSTFNSSVFFQRTL